MFIIKMFFGLLLFFFCCISHLGGFGCMENTPAGGADDLPIILEIFKNDPKVEKCKQFSVATEF